MSVHDLFDTDRWLVVVCTIVMAWWVIQYTLSSPWWKDGVGRSFVYKDLFILLILIPSCLRFIWPYLLTVTESLVIQCVTFGGIALVVGTRCVTFWRIQRPAPAKMWRTVRRKNGNHSGPQPKVPA